MQMCFWELAREHKVQAELMVEIDNAGEPIDFDKLSRMNYLDMVVRETLRKWPSMPFGVRVCNKHCSIRTSDGEMFKFRRGDLIHLPFKTIQRDPKHFYSPETFNPNRCMKSFLAFGLGPRSCPASQFVLLQTKLLIFAILSEYSVEVCDSGTLQSTKFIELKHRVRTKT